MQYRTLGRTNLKVSAIGFGGIPIQRISDDAAVQVIHAALDAGINFIDTARGYTDSEAKIGLALKNRRADAIIATKSMARTKTEMAADIKVSLKTLGIDYIDLYQLHNVKDKASLEQIFKPDGALAALIEAKKDGLIKSIGITGHIKSFLIDAIKTGQLDTVQFPFNVVESDDAGEIFDVAQKLNLGLIIMKPLAGGALTDADLALRYILEYPVSTVIPGMDDMAQIKQNALLGDNPRPLEDAERSKLQAEAGSLGTAFCRRCEYCLPCPQGIDIPTIFLLEGYYTRYQLHDWARERYNILPARAEICLECGDCEEKCPYSLPIRRMLANAEQRLGVR